MKGIKSNKPKENSPKISLKHIKVVKNGKPVKKIHRKESEGNSGLNRKERSASSERKKIISEVSPNPGQSPLPPR